MTTLEELKTQVDDLREVIRMADSDSVDNKLLLQSHTKLLNAIRIDIRGIADGQRALQGVASEQGEALGAMLLTLTRWQDRLVSVDRSVLDLKSDVRTLKTDVSGLKADMTAVKADVSGLKADMTAVKADVSGLKKDMTAVKADVSGLKTEVGGLKTHVAGLKTDMTRLDQRQDRTEVRQDRMDRNIEAIMAHLGVEVPDEPGVSLQLS